MESNSTNQQIHDGVVAINSMIVRRVKVNRSRSPAEMLNATNRKQYLDRNVVKDIPKGKEDEPEIFFFKLGYEINDDNLEKEYSLRGLKPADVYSLGAVNEADRAFSDDYPNGTHWKGIDGNWCYAAFIRWCGDGHRVHIIRSIVDDDWDDFWWFAGVRE